MSRRQASTDPGCLIVLAGAGGVLLGAALGMYTMADADPRDYPCPPGLIWGANGAALGGFSGLVVGWLLGRAASWRSQPHTAAAAPDAEPHDGPPTLSKNNADGRLA